MNLQTIVYMLGTTVTVTGFMVYIIITRQAVSAFVLKQAKQQAGLELYVAAAARQFRYYEQTHRAKNTEDSLKKAHVNKLLADQGEELILNIERERQRRQS